MKKKKESWRIIVAIISVLFIIFMWVKNDIITIYSMMPKEQIVPLIATTIIVTLVKVCGIALAIFLIKFIISKIKNKDKYKS